MMRYFLIRHKASGEFMPQGKRDRGYSHWNPSTGNEFKKAMNVPRLVATRGTAARIISMWASMPNSRFHSSQNSYTGEWDEDIIFKPDGRTKDNLEIVEVNIEEVTS